MVLPRLVEVNRVSYGCGQINENHMSCGRDLQHNINTHVLGIQMCCRCLYCFFRTIYKSKYINCTELISLLKIIVDLNNYHS